MKPYRCHLSLRESRCAGSSPQAGRIAASYCGQPPAATTTTGLIPSSHSSTLPSPLSRSPRKNPERHTFACPSDTSAGSSSAHLPGQSAADSPVSADAGETAARQMVACVDAPHFLCLLPACLGTTRSIATASYCLRSGMPSWSRDTLPALGHDFSRRSRALACTCPPASTRAETVANSPKASRAQRSRSTTNDAQKVGAKIARREKLQQQHPERACLKPV